MAKGKGKAVDEELVHLWGWDGMGCFTFHVCRFTGTGGSVLRILAIAAVLMAAAVGTAGGEEVAADTTREARSPRGAMLRSLALPGWGQFYNRRPIKGSVIAAAELGSAVAFFVHRRRTRREAEDSTSGRNVYLFTTVGAVLYSMVDAYVDAHLDAVDWGEVEAGAGEGGMEVRVRFRVRF